MSAMEFQVCRRGRKSRWVVTLGNSLYGAYLDKEQALLDAVDAARDAFASRPRGRGLAKRPGERCAGFLTVRGRKRLAGSWRRRPHPKNLNWYSSGILLRITAGFRNIAEERG